MERIPYCQCSISEPEDGATAATPMRCIKTGATMFYDADRERPADVHVDVFECPVCKATVAVR